MKGGFVPNAASVCQYGSPSYKECNNSPGVSPCDEAHATAQVCIRSLKVDKETIVDDTKEFHGAEMQTQGTETQKAWQIQIEVLLLPDGLREPTTCQGRRPARVGRRARWSPRDLIKHLIEGKWSNRNYQIEIHSFRIHCAVIWSASCDVCNRSVGTERPRSFLSIPFLRPHWHLAQQM